MEVYSFGVSSFRVLGGAFGSFGVSRRHIDSVSDRR